MKIRKINPNLSYSKPLFGNNAYAYNREAVLYLVIMNLRTFYNECFINTSVGVKWWEKILKRPYHEKQVIQEIKRVILATQNVNKIYSFDYDYDYDTRVLTIQFKLVTNFDIDSAGNIITDIDDENYDMSYFSNLDTNEQYWRLSVSRLSSTTRLYSPNA